MLICFSLNLTSTSWPIMVALVPPKCTLQLAGSWKKRGGQGREAHKFFIRGWPRCYTHLKSKGHTYFRRQLDIFSCVIMCQPKVCYVQFSRSFVSASLWPDGLQHTRHPCPSLTPRAYSNSCASNQCCHPPISSSAVPSPPALNLSQHQGLFKWVSSSHQVAKVLEFQLQHQSFKWSFKTDFL